MIQQVFNRFKQNSHSKSDLDISELPATGSAALDFSLPASKIYGEDDSPDQVSLRALCGKPAVLVFYPADNTSVCTSQLTLYNEALALVREHDARMVAISTDALESHQEFAKKMKLKFPLLSDATPAGAISSNFGVFNKEDGKCERALFVLNAEGKIHWRAIYPRNINPGMDGLLEALETLASKEDSR